MTLAEILWGLSTLRHYLNVDNPLQVDDVNRISIQGIIPTQVKPKDRHLLRDLGFHENEDPPGFYFLTDEVKEAYAPPADDFDAGAYVEKLWESQKRESEAVRATADPLNEDKEEEITEDDVDELLTPAPVEGKK